MPGRVDQEKKGNKAKQSKSNRRVCQTSMTHIWLMATFQSQ